MKEGILRGSRAFGLAARIIVSVFIISVIIWKYDDFKNMDVRALVEASSSVLTAVLTIWGVYLLKSIVVEVYNLSIWKYSFDDLLFTWT